jgi:hypothetical protein
MHCVQCWCWQALVWEQSHGSLDGCVRDQQCHSVLWVSKWELRFALPISSYFLYNKKFLARWSLYWSPVFTLACCLAYSTLEMEVICSSKTSVDFQRVIRHFIPEDSTLHNHQCANLKSYITWNPFHIYSTPSLLTQGDPKTCYILRVTQGAWRVRWNL